MTENISPNTVISIIIIQLCTLSINFLNVTNKTCFLVIITHNNTLNSYQVIQTKVRDDVNNNKYQFVSYFYLFEVTCPSH